MYGNLSSQTGIPHFADSSRKKSTGRGFVLGWAGIFIFIWSLGPSAWGGVLISEPFAYPTGQQLTLSGPGDLTMPAPTTTQWDGGIGFTSGSEWGIGRQETGTSIAAGIGPALRFDGLWPKGGSLQVQTTGNFFATPARGIGVTYESGTLWASYLYQAISVGGSSIVDVRFTRDLDSNNYQFVSGNRRFRNLADASGTASQGGVGGGDTATAASGPNLNDGRVYLLVAKYTNVGAGQTGTASWWALTQENYAAVMAMGLTETALDTHCVDKLVLTNQEGKILTSGTTWLQTPVYQGNALLDQIRYGTSLADVAAPAPVRWMSLYQEAFPNSTSGNLKMSQVGWFAYSGANAQDRTNGPADTGDRVGVSYLAGSPSGAGYGFCVPEGQSDPPRFLVYTTEFTSQFPGGINPKDYEQLWFSWRQHTSGENVQIRLALQVTDPQSGQSWWFASDTAFVNTGLLQTGTGGEFPAEAVVRGMLFSPEGALWRDLTFTPSSTLSLASSARTQDLPPGLITAVGLYLSGPNSTSMRFDTFEIYAMVVPEPSTWGLLALGALLSLGRWLYRRKTVSAQGRSSR